jgi:hypothetical protein
MNRFCFTSFTLKASVQSSIIRMYHSICTSRYRVSIMALSQMRAFDHFCCHIMKICAKGGTVVSEA